MKLSAFASTLALGFCASVAHAQYGQTAPANDGTPNGQPPLNAGGLAPPSTPVPEDPDSAQTEQKLETADQKDSGRGLEWFYLNGEIGAETLGLQTFKANHIVDGQSVPTKQTGLLYGAGLGVRIVFITLGARFRVGTFSHFDLWTLDGEIGLRIPLGSLEPYLMLGGGFASLGSFSASGASGANSSDIDVKGYNIRAGGGLDYYVTPVFSVGGNLTGDLLGLTRPGVDPTKLPALTSGMTGQPTQQQAQQASAELYKASGSSVGIGLTLTAVLGLHF